MTGYNPKDAEGFINESVCAANHHSRRSQGKGERRIQKSGSAGPTAGNDQPAGKLWGGRF